MNTTGKNDFRIIELVTMRDPHTAADHNNYVREIKPYTDKHGLTPNATFNVLKKAAGTAPDHTVQIGLWNLSAPDGLQKIFEDPGYQAHAEHRDRLHDMENLTLYMAKPVFEQSFNKENVTIMDFAVMNKGYGKQDWEKYFSNLEKIGSRFHLRRVASYEIMQFLSGKGPKEAVLVNLYEVPSPATMGQLQQDLDYQNTMVPERDKIFNMQELSVFLTKIS